MSFSIEKDFTSRGIKVWPSLARITATLWIFIYHYLVMMDIPQSPLFKSTYAIVVFCFLSGYFAVNVQDAPHKWIVKRYFRIMVPYWIVMVSIITANCYMQYKQTTILDIIVLLVGGSLFLNDPLYIISWFITLILLLYFAIYLYTIIPTSIKIIFLFFVLYCFSLIPYASIYFASFFFGVLFSKIPDHLFEIATAKKVFSERVGGVLFKIQSYCYCFFLVHGAALHVFLRLVKGQPVKVFVFSFLLSGVASVILYESDKLIRGKVSFIQ